MAIPLNLAGVTLNDSRYTLNGILVDTLIFPLPSTLAEVLRGSHTPVVRVLFMAGDLNSVVHAAPLDVVSGSVTRDRNRQVPGQASVTLKNTDGTYTPENPDSIVWPGRLVRVERGAVVLGREEYVTLLTGLLSQPSQRYGQSSVTFNVWSRLRLLDRPFPQTVSFNAGASLDDVVRAVCEMGGLGTTMYDLDHGGTSLQAARSFDVTDNMLSSVSQLCLDHGLDGPYDNGLGVTMLRPFTEPTAVDIEWTFTPDEVSVLTDLAWSLEERSRVIYNRQDVAGVAPDRYPVRGQARDLNPSSPTYNPPDGSGPLGDLPAPLYTSADIHTEYVANIVAQQLLTELTMADLPVKAQAVPIPLLAPRDVVRFSTDALDVTARIDSITIPLGPGEMTLTAQGLRSLVGYVPPPPPPPPISPPLTLLYMDTGLLMDGSWTMDGSA